MIRNFLPFELSLLLAFALVGCKGSSKPPKEPLRPVTYVTLKTMNPGKTSRLTGSVESWKREDIGFEVAGRVLRVVEPGANIVGRTYDKNGHLLTEGTVLAEVDDERYRIALAQAQAAANAAQADLKKVIPAQLKEANSLLTPARKDYERWKVLVAQKSASQQELDLKEAAFRAAEARVATVEALRATKGSLLNTALAQVEQAKVNIRDCKLFSPFAGQIARVNIIPGGYVLPGQAVVTVQMMDPLKVNIVVSPDTDARINYNDLVRVYTRTGEQLEGSVYLKDTFADPATRTFLVTLLVRNKRIQVGMPDELKAEGVPVCRNLWKLDRPDVGTEGNYYAEINAIHQKGEEHFVWKVENLSIEQLYEDFDPVLTVKKVPVTPGEGRVSVLQVFTFRELTKIGDLKPEEDVIVGDISGAVEDGGKIVLVRDRWLGRPGDVVRVGLKGEKTPAGYYVPEDAIQWDGRQNYVVVAIDAEDGAQQVEFVPIAVGETVGQLQRIEAIGDGDLQEGTKVIVAGAHYVTKGESVRAVDEIQATP